MSLSKWFKSTSPKNEKKNLENIRTGCFEGTPVFSFFLHKYGVMEVGDIYLIAHQNNNGLYDLILNKKFMGIKGQVILKKDTPLKEVIKRLNDFEDHCLKSDLYTTSTSRKHIKRMLFLYPKSYIKAVQQTFKKTEKLKKIQDLASKSIFKK